MGRLLRLIIVGSILCAPSAAMAQNGPSLGPLDRGGHIPYYIEEGTPESSFAPADRDLATWAFESWERATGGHIHPEPAPRDQALIVVHWVPAGGGEYGEMRPVRVGDRVGAAVYIRPDTNGLGPDIAALAGRDPLMRDTIVYLTCVHEIGHALGLSHTSDFRDIMYFFGYGGDIPGFFNRYRARLHTRADIAKVSGLSDADVARVRALYPAH